jgi:hypothetical protein
LADLNPKSEILNLKSILGVFALACLLGTAQASAQEASSAPRLTFSKTLEGSTPEFEQISVDTAGSATYDGRKLSESASPRQFKLSQSTTQRLFALAHRLSDFKSIDLESHKKVANMGRKTFTFEANGQKNSAEFNYSLLREAQELADLFERIGTVQEHIKTLEYSTKYDPLNLPQELLLIQIELNNKSLADPQLLVPVLEQIVRNPRYLHLAQARAQDILQRVHASN